VLKEIESKATFSAQQLQIVRGQITSKQREKRMLELSQKELASIPKETPVYDGVGKMYAEYSAYGGYNANCWLGSF
jgi:prefoldin subunit 1